MPRLELVTAEEMAAAKKVRTPKPDVLAPYLHQLQDVLSNGAVGGRVYLEAGENQRSEKRRYTTAGKQLGKTVKWRSAPAGQLFFEIVSVSEPAPNGEAPKKRGGRPKKTV